MPGTNIASKYFINPFIIPEEIYSYITLTAHSVKKSPRHVRKIAITEQILPYFHCDCCMCIQTLLEVGFSDITLMPVAIASVQCRQ